MELEPERALSPTLTSRYMNNYLTNPSDIYHQNFHPPRQNLHSFYPVDNNNRNYLKRQYYDKDEFDGENERERKYEKLMDYPHQPYHHTSEVYDTYNNNNHLYSNNNTQEERSVADTSLLANPNSNDNYPINSSPSSSVDDDKTVSESPKSLTNGKKTKGRVKIKMEYIENKLRRYTTFSKRKTGIMKKAYELSTLTGTQVMLLVASETGHVYTFATRKLQPMITSEAGKALIQTCLNTPELSDQSAANGAMINEQRMSATGFEETELTFDIQDLHDIPDKANKVRQLAYNASHQNVVPPNISSHSHIYNLPHAPQHYPHSPQTAHHYSSPHYSPPSPLTSQHFQAPPVSAFPGFYENTGTSNACPPLGSYQTIRPPSATEDKSSKT